MLSRVVLSAVYKLQGKSRFHKIFEIMHNLSLRGMNYGVGAHPLTNGESFTLHWIKRRIQSKPVVLFDIGANTGEYTKLLLAVFKQPLQIHVFEPSGRGFEALAALNFDETVVLNKVGLGSKDAVVPLFYNHEGSALGSLYQRNLKRFGITLDKHESVSITTLDRYCEKEKIGFIDFVKIDVEGHELEVLEGSMGLLSGRKIRYIQFEFGGTGIDSKIFFRDIFELLFSNYRIYRILKDGFFEIKQYSEVYEIFLYSNFLAVVRE